MAGFLSYVGVHSSTPPASPSVVIPAPAKRARTSSVPSIETSNSFAALEGREPEPVEDLTLAGSQHAPGNASNDASADLQQQQQQPPPKDSGPVKKSYSAAAQGPRGDPQPSRPNKRKDSPQNGAPDRDRGHPWYLHERYESYLRPAPQNVQKNVLWIDTTQCFPVHKTAAEILAEAVELIGTDAVGYVTSGGLRSLGIVFPSATGYNKYADTKLPCGVTLYRTVDSQGHLQRYTLQGVPVEDHLATTTAIQKAFREYGEVIEIVPLLLKNSSWASDTVHVTVSTASATARLAPETIDILDSLVLVHVPGKRRVCLYCHSVEHTNEKCRQAQRLAARRSAQQSTADQQQEQERNRLRQDLIDTGRELARQSAARKNSPWDEQNPQDVARDAAAQVAKTPSWIGEDNDDDDDDDDPNATLDPEERQRRQDQWEEKNSDNEHSTESDDDVEMTDARTGTDNGTDTGTTTDNGNDTTSLTSNATSTTTAIKRVTRSQKA